METLFNILNSLTFIKALLFGSALVAGLLITLALLPDEKRAVAKRRLGVKDEGAHPNKVAILKWLRPIYSRIAPSLAGRKLGDRNEINRKLISANLRDEINPDEFIGFKFVMAIVIPLMCIYVFGALGRPLPVYSWLFVAAGGFFFPELWLKERIRIRRREILRVMPYTLDLLTLSVEAGLDFVAAIQRMTERSRENALATEFGHMLKEIRLGTSRSDALRNLSDRLQIEEMTSFTTLLIQTDQLGADIGPVLRAQSDQLRAKRFHDAEAAGARASQLVLIPLVLLILPAIFIVVAGPAVLSFLRSGLF